MKKGVLLYILIFMIAIGVSYSLVPDSDQDGVPDVDNNGNIIDRCINTQTTDVDQFGCSCAQKDCVSDDNPCTDDCGVVDGLAACNVPDNTNSCVNGNCAGGSCIQDEISPNARFGDCEGSWDPDFGCLPVDDVGGRTPGGDESSKGGGDSGDGGGGGADSFDYLGSSRRAVLAAYDALLNRNECEELLSKAGVSARDAFSRVLRERRIGLAGPYPHDLCDEKRSAYFDPDRNTITICTSWFDFSWNLKLVSILHEIGHMTGAIEPERGSTDAYTVINAAIFQSCIKTDIVLPSSQGTEFESNCNPNYPQDLGPCIGNPIRPCQNTNSQYYPPDTICKGDWPNTGGVDMSIKFTDFNDNIHYYGDVDSCAYYEVCSATIDKYVQEAVDCCENNNKNDVECSFAKANSNGNPKKCEGLYLIKSAEFGKYNPNSHSGGVCCASEYYPEWKWFCDQITNSNGLFYGRCDSPGGLGNGYTSPISNILNQLPCNTNLKFSNTDLQSNSCISSLYIPTSLSIEKMRVRGCTLDSGILTTLLRKAGYQSNEVMTVQSQFHAFVLVKLPLELKYILITNYLMDKTNHENWCQRQWVECHNDNGIIACPSKSEVYGCEGLPYVQSNVCNGCVYNERCYNIGERECVNGIYHRCIGQNKIQQKGACDQCPGCVYNNKCYNTSQTECIGNELWQCVAPNKVEKIDICCPGGCKYEGRCYAPGETGCIGNELWQCTGQDGAKPIGPCPNQESCAGCVYEESCYPVGEKKCIGNQEYTCFGLNDIRPTTGCCGCQYYGKCYRLGETDCISNNRYQCTGYEQISFVGPCCSGCFYNDRCYGIGDTECVSNVLYRCSEKDTIQVNGSC